MKIGVIGGGQLGRADYDDKDHLRRLADEVDLVTFEFESVPAETVAFLSQFVPVYPSAESLRIARDRWFEKSMFKDLGIPTPDFADIQSQADLDAAVASIGLPAVLKTRTLGYDGKGQKLLRKPADVAGAFAELGSVPCILEGFVPFTGEVSLIAVRGRDGETCFYPLVHNSHESGILRLSVASSKLGESAMLNFIGEVPPVEKVIAIEDCHLHHYGKAFKVGRKVGHATLRCPDRATLDRQITAVETLIPHS